MNASPDVKLENVAEESTRSNSWVGIFYEEIKDRLSNFVDQHLRKDLRTKFADDVLQESIARLLEELKSGKLSCVDASNWRQPDALAVLKRWIFTTVRFILFEKLRDSQRYDHGSEALETIPAKTSADATTGELASRVAVLLRERSASDQRVFERTEMEGGTDADLAKELGVKLATVRVKRHRTLNWLKAQLAENPQ